MTQDPTSAREMVSPLEAARILGVCYDTVRRQIANGTIPAFRVGRSLRISPDALDALMGIDEDDATEEPSDLAQMTAFVYFVHARGWPLVKIGSARDVKRRLAALRSSSPAPIALLASIPTTLEQVLSVEHAAHAHFAKSRHHGEWFSITESEAIEYAESHGGTVHV